MSEHLGMRNPNNVGDGPIYGDGSNDVTKIIPVWRDGMPDIGIDILPAKLYFGKESGMPPRSHRRKSNWPGRLFIALVVAAGILFFVATIANFGPSK